VIDRKLQLKHASAAKISDMNKNKNIKILSTLKIFRVELELFYAIVPALFVCF